MNSAMRSFFHLGHSDRLELMLDAPQCDVAVMGLNLDDLKELGDVPNELAIFASESQRYPSVARNSMMSS